MAGFTILFAGGAAVFAALTYCQTRRQADLIQESQRPWIAAPTIEIVNEQDFVFDFTNIGSEPAVGLYIDAYVTTDGIQTFERGTSLCDEITQNFPAANKLFAVLPHGVWPVPLTVMPNQVEKRHVVPALQSGSDYSFIGCVVYGIGYGGLHHTAFFSAIHYDAGRSGKMLFSYSHYVD